MKKIFTMIVSVVLLATMVVGGTLATSVLGPLQFPFPNDGEKATPQLIQQTVTVSELYPPYTDYTVSVTNKSNDKVYVRTLFAFEVLDVETTENPYLNLNEKGITPVMEQNESGTNQQVRITVDKKNYDVYECYYSIEKKGTATCLQGFTFAEQVKNDDFVNEQYCIMTLSQAIAADATSTEYETEVTTLSCPENVKQLFGAVTSENHPWQDKNNSWQGEQVTTQTNMDVQ